MTPSVVPAVGSVATAPNGDQSFKRDAAGKWHNWTPPGGGETLSDCQVSVLRNLAGWSVTPPEPPPVPSVVTGTVHNPWIDAPEGWKGKKFTAVLTEKIVTDFANMTPRADGSLPCELGDRYDPQKTYRLYVVVTP